MLILVRYFQFYNIIHTHQERLGKMVSFSPPPRHLTLPGQFVSLLCFASYFTVLPSLLKLIWPSFLQLSGLTLYLGVIFCCNLMVLGFYNIIMWYVYQAKIPFFQKYRDTDKPWPWESDPIKWKVTLKKTLISVIANLLLFTPILPTYEYLTGQLYYKRSLQDWPSSFTMLWQVMIFVLSQDFLFYWSHRILHHPKLYWIHKKHHEYNITMSLAVTYAHPLDYMFGSAVTTGLGYHLLSKFTAVHYVTIISYLIMRLLQTCQGHCGYDWSWGQMSFIPWKNGPDYHDFHHSHNVGNFGSMFGFWDAIMGTNYQYLKYQQKLKQTQKQK